MIKLFTLRKHAILFPMKTVLLTRRVPTEIVSRLREHFVVRTNDEDTLLSGASLVERASGCFGILANLTEKFDRSVLSQLPDLRIVANMAVGVNNIDTSFAKEKNIVVSNTPDVLTESTADLAIALCLNVARRCTEAEAFLRRGEWKVWSFGLLSGFDFSSSTVGIVGLGRIGSAIAKRAHFGFGCRIR
jgi:gluconate 2-dehydrogenase